MKLITLAASIALTLACQQNQIASQTEGHFEEFTQEQLESHENKQTVVAEHAANSSIVLSLNAITNFGKEALFASILEAGAEKIYVTVPKNYGSSFGPSQNLDTIKDQGEDFAKLRSVIGSEIEKVELIEQVEEGYLTVWARDWAPLGALDEEGNPVLVDINYYPHRVGDDSTARSMGKIESFNRISLPVYNEGGNFMSNTRNECLMTSRVVDANAIKAIPGDIILNSDRIKEYYTKYAGCEKVHIFQRMPYEGTGHIDMWAKFLDDDTILLSELRDEAIDVLAIDSSDRAAAKEIQAYLKEMRLEVESLGYNVVTIPMPTPMVSPSAT